MSEDDSRSAEDQGGGSIAEAYAALESAATEVPEARFPEMSGTIEVIEAGEKPSSEIEDAPETESLFSYFGNRGFVFGVSVLQGPLTADRFLASLEDAGIDQTLLVIPTSASSGTARDLLDAGAVFVSFEAKPEDASCFGSGDQEVHPCSESDLPG